LIFDISLLFLLDKDIRLKIGLTSIISTFLKLSGMVLHPLPFKNVLHMFIIFKYLLSILKVYFESIKELLSF
jgi:hypothetical protein